VLPLSLEQAGGYRFLLVHAYSCSLHVTVMEITGLCDREHSALLTKRVKTFKATRLLDVPNTNNPSVAPSATATTTTGEPDGSRNAMSLRHQNDRREVQWHSK
jgi:hypothetical protein